MTNDPRFFALDSSYRDELRKPFAPEQIGKLPKAGVRLDYVGHAAVTDRLNAVAPDWTYTLEEPYRDKSGNITGVLGHMTIGGKTLPEVGSVDRAMSDAEAMKQAISDFIRRGAMRFGVALDLWSKEELPGGKDVEAGGYDRAPAHAAPAIQGTEPVSESGQLTSQRRQQPASTNTGEGSDGDEPAGPSPEHIPGVDGPKPEIIPYPLGVSDRDRLLLKAEITYGGGLQGRRLMRQAWGKLHPGKAIPFVADLSDDELRALIEAKAAES